MILCCGEALIDMLPRETQSGEAVFAPFPGGSVFNTAIALGRLGANVQFFSGISTDIFGSRLTDALSSSDVKYGLSKFTNKPTTLAFVTLRNGQAEYAFYDENTAGRSLGIGDLPEIPDEVGTLFFGGISLMVEPCAEAYEALCLRESPDRGIVLDPNIRPDFIQDEPRYRARLERMLRAADIVKVSDEDLMWIEGRKDPRALLERGPKLVFLTEGAKGARAITKDHDIIVEIRKVEVVDTVGAGDTFNAGVMASLDLHDRLTKTGIARINEANLKTALTLGVRAAAVTVSRAGANPPKASEL